MYYYIFDLKKCRKKNSIEDIKNYLSSLGISGEYTYPSAAQTTEELVDLALSKKYNTIVGIGGDDIANSIAGKLQGRPEAMGIIPLEITDDLSALIGAKTWKEGCDSLRFRKILEMRLGKTANNQYFITKASLDIKQPTEVTIEFKDYIVQAKVNNLEISNYSPRMRKIGDDFLDITMGSINKDSSIFKTALSSIFGVKSSPKEFSLLRARSLRIFTKSQLPIIVDNYSIAKTPQLIETTDEPVRIITAKKIETKTD